MSGILLLTHQSTSPEGLPKTWVELSSGEKISCHREETAEAIYNVMNKQYFWDIETWVGDFETWFDISEQQKEHIKQQFSNPVFLHFLEGYISREILDLYTNGNANAFRKVSALGFLLAKWQSEYVSILSDIHNIDLKKLERIFRMYEAGINKTSKKDNILFRQNLNLYIKLIDAFTLISIFNEMDHDRKAWIHKLVVVMKDSIKRVREIEWVLEEGLWHDTYGSERETFWEALLYVEGRLGVNFAHSKKIIFEGRENFEIISDFSKSLNEIYEWYEKLKQVKFLSRPGWQNSLTGAFIANATSLMFALIQHIKKYSSDEQWEVFNHHDFEELLIEYQTQINSVFPQGDSLELLNKDMPVDFQGLNQYCLDVTTMNYNRVLHPERLKSMDSLSVIADLQNAIEKNKLGKQIEFRMDFLYQILQNSSHFPEQTLLWLLTSLVQFEKFDHYHTQAVKIKLIDILLKKIFESTQKAYQNEDILEQTLHYIEKNKKNSLLLNVYARLYLTLSYCYSKISSQKQKSMNLYFIYEELATSKEFESLYGISSEDIFHNVFGQWDVVEITQQEEYSRYNKKFINEQWHTIQKLINELDGTKKLEAFEEGLELINEWFFHGMVHIWVIMDEVDEESTIPRGYSRERMAFEMDGIAHTILLDYPTNYRKNFFEIYNTRIGHLQEQILVIYNKLELYTTPVEKRIQNQSLKALAKNESAFVAYRQAVTDYSWNVVALECLCRLVDKNGDEVLFYNEEGDRLYINKVIEVLDHLGLSIRATKDILSDVFYRASYEKKCEFNVNLSYKDIMNEEIHQYISELKVRYPGTEKNVVIELLENQIHDKPAYVEQLRKFSQQGFKMVIDDFGSDYNNVSVLQLLHKNNIPIYKLKIDRVIIDDLISKDDILKINCSDEDKVRMLQRSLSAEANILNFVKQAEILWITWGVVAEYIRNTHQKDICHKYGVRYFQGSFYEMPRKFEKIWEIKK